MANQIDSERLRTRQYNTSSKLSARIRLHELYGTSSVDWHKWFFQFVLRHMTQDGQILELGCGRGDLWQKNADLIAPGWRITLTDFSAGMLTDCKSRLNQPSNFSYDIVNAQDIPYEDNRFNIVIANHMLYHVPDRMQALAGIRRVLKPEGVLLATTNGEKHMFELMLLAEQFIPALAAERDDYGFVMTNFSLENGANQLARHFSNIQMERFDNNLYVTDVDPFMDYIGSMTADLRDQTNIIEYTRRLRDEVQKRIARDGGIHITKDAGVFIASG